jgi:SpoVK/Ycf46/Vps4 family AAA+-type ATPase
MVAGYEYVKRYLSVIKRAIRQGASDPSIASIVPKGIMMLGPPGTGKSFMAASLAKETGFNMVKFRNIRSMWVGETERNLNRVLDLISAMHTVIVFVDEIDAALGQRGDSQGGGGGGVERRIFQRILEFMAMDENRGRVLWIAASNRPDLIDAALISRFDLVIPFLLPDAAARRAMLTECYPAKIGYQFEPESDRTLEKCVDTSRGFTGRELDTVCRHALQLSGEEHLGPQAEPSTQATGSPIVTSDHVLSALQDFRQARDPLVHELQILLAIQATNFRRFLPSKEQMRKQLPEEIWSEQDDDIDPQQLSRYVRRLSLQLQRSGRL